MDTKILKRLVREKYGKYRPNANEILQIIKENNLKPAKKKRGRPPK